jgi:polyisoprenyl-phosphate glycosyltransferase
MNHLSIVIPVQNESTLVNELLNRVRLNVEKITQDFKVIIVDDGSVDDTWILIKEFVKTDDRVMGIRLSRNFGQHFAITAGIHTTDSEWVVVMDGDLQDRPEVIPELYNKAKEGYEIVFVSRENRPESLPYRILQRVFYWLLRRLSGINFDSRQANFSIISQKVVNAFKAFPERARFYYSTVKWLGFKSSSISADHGTRHSGSSSYSLRKRLKLASDIIISFSDRPLKFAIYAGAVLSALAIFSALFILVGVYLWGYSQAGWASLIVGIAFLNGSVLFVLGIIGEYIGRIFHEVKSRPLFIISEKTF